MTELICLKDSYARECEAIVKEVREGKFVILDRTIFYPRGGGQQGDTGKLFSSSGESFRVLNTSKKDGEVLHEMEIGPQIQGRKLEAGDSVKCIIDWERRYGLMRSHTATHVLAAIMNKEEQVLITGNKIGEDKTRVDFNLQEPTPEKISDYIQKTNHALRRNLEVSVSSMPREEAMKIPGMVKLAGALPPSIHMLRIVKIGDVDEQADGGTHVKNTGEVGEIELLKMESRGKDNRRLYFKLKD